MPIRRVLLIALLLFLGNISGTYATTYYSRTSGGSWGNSTTWSTVTYGNATNTGTYPKNGDIVFIGDGYHIFMNMNSFCKNVTIGQSSSGILEISDVATYSMVISGSVLINPGAKFIYNGVKSRTQTLTIVGNLTNNGTMDMYSSATDLVNVTFGGQLNSIISGAGVYDFNKVTLHKSTLTSYYMDVQSNGFENAIRQLTITYGTYIHNNLGTYNVNPTLTFTLPANGIVQVPQGQMNFSSTMDFMYLEGQLAVTGGSVQVGSTAGNKGLRYSQNGATIPQLIVSAGNLLVYGGITYKKGTAALPFQFTQSNGTILLNSGTNGTNTEVFKVTDVASSSFTMSGGVIILEKPSTGGSAISDFAICGSAGVVNATGGVIQYGDGSTGNGKVFNFVPYPNVVQPSFQVTGPAGNLIKLKTSQSSSSDFKLLSLYIDINKVFDIRSVSGTPGDTKKMTLTHEYDGINALINNGSFTARQSTVLLQAPEGQWLGGSVTTDFYNLTINNSFGISLGLNENVTHALLLTNGIIYTNSSAMITCTSTGFSNIGSSISYIDGPFGQVVASVAVKNLNLPVGKNGIYRPMILAVQHTTVASVTYTSEVWNASARVMGYTLPATLTWVSDIRYYSIDRTSVANINKARLTMSYGSDDIVTDYNNLRIASYNGAGGWLNRGGVGSANNAGNITSANFNSFNRLFTLANASGGTNPLPEELVSFNAQKVNHTSELKWTTASEKNSDYFAVERSNDGVHFNEIGNVKSAGNSTTFINYLFTDNTPVNGKNYYRLKQVDFDGTATYSSVKMINASAVSQVTFYPNPANSNSGITITTPENLSGHYTIRIFDLTGRVVAEQSGDASEMKTIPVTIENTLATGCYLLQLSDSNNGIWQGQLLLNQ